MAKSICIAIMYITGFTTNQDEFLAKLPDEYNFHPCGELLHVYRQDDIQFEVYKVKYIICIVNYNISSFNYKGYECHPCFR